MNWVDVILGWLDAKASGVAHDICQVGHVAEQRLETGADVPLNGGIADQSHVVGQTLFVQLPADHLNDDSECLGDLWPGKILAWLAGRGGIHE